ncbi:MAG: substrate-binding domain-containing protein [Phycisphaeraceae bacterium]
MTRRFVLLVLGGFLLTLVGIGGCDNRGGSAGGGGASTSNTPADGEKPLHIGVAIPTADHGWPAGVGWWAQQTMKKYPGVKWEFQRATTGAEQDAQIKVMLQKGIDGLVVLPWDSDGPLPAIKEAKRQGVYVVSVDRGLREPVADIYIAGDNRAFGRKAAQYMVEKLGGKGKIVILRGLPVEIDAERHDTAMGVFKQHSGVEVLGAQPGNWHREDAYKVMQNFLTQFPQIDAVWASDDDMALGVEQAIREAGRQDQMWILGGAGMKDIVKKVMDKDVMYPADITYPPGMIAAGMDLCVGHLRSDKPAEVARQIPPHLGVDEAQVEKALEKSDKQTDVHLDVHLITPENAKEFYFPESVY